MKCGFASSVRSSNQRSHKKGGGECPSLKVSAERIIFVDRSEEHTSELQSLMRISYAVSCLKKKKPRNSCSKINSKSSRHKIEANTPTSFKTKTKYKATDQK